MSYRAAVSLRSQSAILHPPILQMHPPPYNLISAPHLFAERFSVFTWMNPFWRTHLCFPFLCVPQFWFPQCCIRRPPLSSHSALTLFRSKSLRRCSDQFFFDTFAFFASSISNPLSVTRYCSNASSHSADFPFSLQSIQFFRLCELIPVKSPNSPTNSNCWKSID